MLRCIRRRVLWQSSSIISPSHHCSHLRRSWRWRGNYISIIGRVTIRFAVFLRLISIRSTPCSRRPDNLWLSSRVQNGPLCPRDLPAAASRVQKAPPCPRDRVTDVLPADCQQRAGLHSLRSLRPLPTSTASPLCGNLYPSGPSPCPCPGVDTPPDTPEPSEKPKSKQMLAHGIKRKIEVSGDFFSEPEASIFLRRGRTNS